MNVFQTVASLRPVITGERYSDLISSAAYHERAAFLLIEVAPFMAQTHAYAAMADRLSAAEWAGRPPRFITALEGSMDDETASVARGLDAAGYEALWAKNKGGGFWLRGIGYKSLYECMALISPNRRNHEADAEILRSIKIIGAP